MPQQPSPWGTDPARTQRGVAPFGIPETQAPTAGPHKLEQVRYRLGTRLGPTGQVYEAQSAAHAGTVAVKLFPFAVGLAPAAVGAFTREVTRVADLRHPHVAQVMRAGTFADGTPFVVMERLFGQTLDAHVAGRGALPPSEVLPIIRGIASALSAAHAAGVVHREVRLDNIFIATLTGYESGFAKVLDFGVSRLTAAARAAGRIVGHAAARTPPPEQRQDSVETADERTDQFSLAALAYRLLTGSEVAPGDQSGPAFERVRDNALATTASYVPCPPEVATVLAKAMSQRPENRFGSVAVFLRVFQDALASAGGLHAPPLPVAASETARPHGEALSGPSTTARLFAGPLATTTGPTSIPGRTGPDLTATMVSPRGTGGATTVAAAVVIGADQAAPPAAAPSGDNAPSVRGSAAPDAPTVRFKIDPRAASGVEAPTGWPGETSSPPPEKGGRPFAAVGSLTEQFFVEGDRQEANQWADSPLVTEDYVDARSVPDRGFESFDRPPKRRGPLIVAAALCVIGLGITAWATGWLSGDATTTSAPELAQPAAAPAPPLPSPIPAQAATPAAPAPERTLPGIAPRPGAAPDRAPTAAVTGRSPAPPPAAARVAPSSTETAADPPARQGSPTSTARDQRQSAARASAPGQTAAGSAPKGPLRGYTWSEKRRRLIRSSPAQVPTDSGPPPATDSGPPPPTDSGPAPLFPAAPAPPAEPSPSSSPSPPPTWSPPLLEPTFP